MIRIDKVYLLCGADVSESKLIGIYSSRDVAERVKAKIGSTGSWDSYFIDEEEVIREYEEPNFMYHLSVTYFPESDRQELDRRMSYKQVVEKGYIDSEYVLSNTMFEDSDDWEMRVEVSSSSNKSFLDCYQKIKEEYKEWSNEV